MVFEPPYLLSSGFCNNQYYNCPIRVTISLCHKTTYLRSGASFWTSQALLSWGSLWIGETNAHWLTMRSLASVNQRASFWYACSQELTCGPWGPLDPLFPIGPSWPCLKKSKTFLVSGIVQQQIFTDKSWFLVHQSKGDFCHRFVPSTLPEKGLSVRGYPSQVKIDIARVSCMIPTTGYLNKSQEFAKGQFVLC